VRIRFGFCSLLSIAVGCNSSIGSPSGAGGAGAPSGKGGVGGSAGIGGTGATAGTPGNGGAAGTVATAGSGGAAGTTGTGGIGGTAGLTGTGGVAGTAGLGGSIGRGGTTGGGGMSGQGGGASCASIERPTSNLLPDILLLQDASNSMNNDITDQLCANPGCGATSKWSVMTAAIKQVVAETESEVNWGLKLFPDTSACTVNNGVAVGVGAMNSAAIAAAITARTDAAGNVVNGGQTPTRTAENAAATYLGGLTDPNHKFIVLATDGLPNCPASGSPQNDDTNGAVTAVTAARNAGFSTFVVGIALTGGTADSALNMMASAGGYPQLGQSTQYYPVTSTAQFETVLRSLVSMANSCTFNVPAPPTTDGTTSRADIAVKVTAGGNVGDIPQDASVGWTYTNASMTSIEFHGVPCDQWKAGSITSVTIVFHCHAI